MKFLLSFFTIVSLIVVAKAYDGFYYRESTADQDFLLKQKKIYNLFYHLPQSDIINVDMYNEGKDYSIEANKASYTDQDAVDKFLELYKYGFLPRGGIFSLLYPKMLREMKMLFELFYYAKDFDTFYKTALWARVYINEGQFICALYQAVIRRPDTMFIQLPPPYELHPHAFYNSEVIESAKSLRMYHKIGGSDSNSYLIRANYSGWYIQGGHSSETKLNYFTEDIGLNSYYFFLRQNNPFWLDSKFGLDTSSRGEEYFYTHNLLYLRYNLERLANGLPKIDDFDWNSEFYHGYYPTMSYRNGLPFPHRPNWKKVPYYKYKFLFAIQEIESRVSTAIDTGFIIDADGRKVNIYTPEGLNILGNLIEGNADSCNKDFYGSIDNVARRILGYNLEPKTPYQIIPSALETYSSCLRDPAFYSLYKRIGYYYYRYKYHLKPYPKNETSYPGLKIESVAVDKLMTYFDDYDATISNGLPAMSQKDADTLLIKVRQQRLNHKPFTVHFTINSDIAQKVSIKLFLGPKYDAQKNLLEFSENYRDFYELDSWMTDLVAGGNKLERNSHDFFFLRPDDEPSEIFYRRVEKAIGGSEQLVYKENVYGFPERLLLPKGRRGGSIFQLFVFVSPVKETFLYKSRIFGHYLCDSRAMGYPLDRPIYRPHFEGPNMFFKDVTIYFKSDIEPNASS